MPFRCEGSVVFIPDQKEPEEALRRTTHLAIGAHQDDLEIMAYHGILRCYGTDDRWFSGVTVTDGAGSPRTGIYADLTDGDMCSVRKLEQNKAALVGEFAAMIQLNHPSKAAKDPANSSVVDDLTDLLTSTRPECLYTHNLADKHDTHIGVALKTIQALRALPRDLRPKTVYGCEVWRDLDWLLDEDKVGLDVAGRDNLAAALLGVFDSQICGGKRYDLATIGRRRAHATYHASHATDETTSLTFAMDLMPLVEDASLDPAKYVAGLIRRLSDDVVARIERMS